MPFRENPKYYKLIDKRIEDYVHAPMSKNFTFFEHRVKIYFEDPKKCSGIVQKQQNHLYNVGNSGQALK